YRVFLLPCLCLRLFLPKGNVTKGPIAKEVVERYNPVGKIASQVV
ncbi:hypothetical protein HRED_04869, partial [Candidatus Haloredivivus sp. G17]